ncbi:MAG: phage head spike fiber domain-containing protein [Sphingomonas sp.]
MAALGFGHDFAPGRWERAPAAFDFTGGVMPPGASLSRASPASWTDAGGSIRIAAADAARFDHDPATHLLRGLLIEPAATNLIADSNAFAGEDWSGDCSGTGAFAPAVSTAAVAAPDGSISASRIDFVRGNGFSRLLTNAATVADRYTFSIWLRAAAGSGKSIALRIDTTDGATLQLASSWQRVSLTAAAQRGALAAQLLLWASIEEAPLTAAVEAWGAQVELGDAPTSTIPTDGAVGQRAADRLNLRWSRFGIADGARRVRCLFDDGSVQVIDGSITDGEMAIAAPLARPWLRRVEIA